MPRDEDVGAGYGGFGGGGNGGGGGFDLGYDDDLTAGQFSVDQYSGIEPENGFDWGAFSQSLSLGAPLGPMAAIGLGIYSGTKGMEFSGTEQPTGGVNGGDGGGGGVIAGTTATAAPMSEQDLNIQRYDIATSLMTPYIDASGSARDQLMVEMGLSPGESGAYMETPAYQALLDERLGAVQQGAASTKSLYSGRRMQAAADVGGATQTQFYDNYMNILQNLANPGAATNLASMGLGQGIQATQQQIGVSQRAAEASAAKKADERLAWANIVSSFMGDSSTSSSEWI